MLYRVLVKSITYTDAKGVERRAQKGETVRLELRPEAKRLVKDEAVQLLPENETGVDNNFYEVGLNPIKDDVVLNPEKKIKKGAKVRALIDGMELEGEVTALLKNGKANVKFEGDTQNFRQIFRENVEVID